MNPRLLILEPLSAQENRGMVGVDAVVHLAAMLLKMSRCRTLTKYVEKALPSQIELEIEFVAAMCKMVRPR